MTSLRQTITLPVSAAQGGTGVANAAANTVTLGGPLVLSGAFTTTLTVTGTTTITLPTAGTLLVSGGALGAASATSLSVAGDVTYSVASAGPTLKQGANGRCGTFVANGVTPVVVSNSIVAITDTIIISLNTGGGTIGTSAPVVVSITAGVGFSTKALALDSSTYNYAILKNAV